MFGGHGGKMGTQYPCPTHVHACRKDIYTTHTHIHTVTFNKGTFRNTFMATHSYVRLTAHSSHHSFPPIISLTPLSPSCSMWSGFQRPKTPPDSWWTCYSQSATPLKPRPFLRAGHGVIK